MQPRRRPLLRSVTNTPRRSPKTPSVGTCSGKRPKVTASTTIWRAYFKIACRSASEGDGIACFLVSFQRAEFTALLDAVVELSPEAQEILRGRDQSTGDDQPQQQQGETFERRVAGGGNQHSYGTDLQHHFRFSDGRRGDGHSFCRRD